MVTVQGISGLRHPVVIGVALRVKQREERNLLWFGMVDLLIKVLLF